MSFKDIFPPIETALEMEPEELAPFVLKYLATQPQINQQAIMDLFAGAIGTFKNPSSHRDVDYRPEGVADIIGIANQLLRIVDEIA